MGGSTRLSFRGIAQARRQPSTSSNSNTNTNAKANPCPNPNGEAGLPRPLPPRSSPQPNAYARAIRVAWRASVTRIFSEKCAEGPKPSGGRPCLST